jgi:hypothetical protein
MFAGDERSVELLTVETADVEDGVTLPVLIASGNGLLAGAGQGSGSAANPDDEVLAGIRLDGWVGPDPAVAPDLPFEPPAPVHGTVTIPTPEGLILANAVLDAAAGELTLFLPAEPHARQRRGAPRLPVGLPLRGSALPANLPPGTRRASAQIRFHGVTMDLAPGGVSALLVVESPGLRLPSDITDVFVEIAPDGPRAIVASLNGVALRSDVLRAEFAFLPLLDWLYLSAQAEQAAERQSRE